MARRGRSFLNQRAVDRETNPGRYYDGYGEGLYLNVKPVKSNDPAKRGRPPKSWVVKFTVEGRRRELGLGSAYIVKLEEAREKARAVVKEAREGVDPVQEREEERAKIKEEQQAKANQITFKEAAHHKHQTLLPTFKSGKHGQLWISGLANHAFPHIGDTPISQLGKPDVLRVLEPIWTSKYDTARRVRQRMALVFEWARGAGHYQGENPVDGIKASLPKVTPKVQNRRAIDDDDLPAFMFQLSRVDKIEARALEFLVLTGMRSKEVMRAEWSEIEGDVWTIPAEVMKMKRPHRVPLSKQAMAVAHRVRGKDDKYLFPGLNENSLLNLITEMGYTDETGKRIFTPHGFRSTLSTWLQELEEDRPAPDVRRACLSHRVAENDTDSRYARSDLLELRVPIMARWAEFATKRVPRKRTRKV